MMAAVGQSHCRARNEAGRETGRPEVASGAPQPRCWGLRASARPRGLGAAEGPLPHVVGVKRVGHQESCSELSTVPRPCQLSWLLGACGPLLQG